MSSEVNYYKFIVSEKNLTFSSSLLLQSVIIFISRTSNFLISFIQYVIFISFITKSNPTCHQGKLLQIHHGIMLISLIEIFLRVSTIFISRASNFFIFIIQYVISISFVPKSNHIYQQ